MRRNTFFLAAARWQLGEKDKARHWFDRAVEWMEKNQPNNEELRRIRAELAPDTEMIEWVCNESNQRVERWVGRASDERKSEVQVAADILAKYAGTYEEQRPFWRALPRVVEITVSNGRLFADMDGRGKVPLIASSATEFSGLYGLGVEFIRDGASGLFVKHVSGNYRFARK